MNNQTCYMCDNLATTKEHLLPKCLFPEKKDLKDTGLDLIKDLIIVPSCEEHNFKKSGDDEYLFNTLSMTLQTGEFGHLNFETKVMRSWSRKDRVSKLKIKLLSAAKAIKIIDLETQDIYETLALTVDRQRLKDTLNYCASGLYFHKFGNRYIGVIDSTPLFSPYPHKDFIVLQNKMEDYYSNKFNAIQRKGNNPSIFQYALYQDSLNKMLVLQMWFYEGCKVISFFR